MSEYIIGIDPGDSTGVALFEDGVFISAMQGSVQQMLTLLELLLDKAQSKNYKVIIAIERFTPGRRVVTHQPTAQQVIGAVENLGRRYEARVVQQGATDAHGIADTALLKRLNMYQSGKHINQPDANDANMAIRHALLTLARERATQFTTLVSPVA